MEGRRTYRWERRRKRFATLSQARAFRSFWAFELILLVLIFAVWLIGARILQVYAVTQHLCVEGTASFGQTDTSQPIFEALFWTCVLLFGFWLAITLCFEPVLKQSKSTLFHASLLVCIFLLAINFRMMHLNDNIPPDGVLSVRPMIVDTSGVIPTYHPRVGYEEPYSRWHLGMPDRNLGYQYYKPYQSCVWLDRNLISNSVDYGIDEYDSATFSEKTKMLAQSDRAKNQTYDADEDRMIPNNSPQPNTWRFGQSINLNDLRDVQKYRPLSPSERERFLKKQACLKANAEQSREISDCKWYFIYDSDTAILDYYMGREKGLVRMPN